MVDLSRFRRRRTEANPRFYDKPSRERHFFSIIGSVLSFVLLVVALALREWAKAGDSRCDYIFGLTKVYINHRTRDPPSQDVMSMSDFYKQDQQILISCILSVTVLTLVSSVVATIISFGYPREKMEFLRHYSVFNIVSLLCIVLVAGLWLAVVESLPQGKAPPSSDCIDSVTTTASTTSGTPDIIVNFGYCFYFLLVGGAFSLGGAAINLLFARSAADRRRSLRDRFRQRQNREAAQQRDSSSSRDLTRPPGAIPPPYSALEEELDTGAETTETSMSEPEYSEQDEPISPPPPYVP